uniref:RxLR effector protein n=2 Tax=Hyaloperonospora arabidopsidis (strain Emoy2) TaxID=559515 RepID=M4B6E8_HYAAE
MRVYCFVLVPSVAVAIMITNALETPGSSDLLAIARDATDRRNAIPTNRSLRAHEGTDHEERIITRQFGNWLRKLFPIPSTSLGGSSKVKELFYSTAQQAKGKDKIVTDVKDLRGAMQFLETLDNRVQLKAFQKLCVRRKSGDEVAKSRDEVAAGLAGKYGDAAMAFALYRRAPSTMGKKSAAFKSVRDVMTARWKANAEITPEMIYKWLTPNFPLTDEDLFKPAFTELLYGISSDEETAHKFLWTYLRGDYGRIGQVQFTSAGYDHIDKQAVRKFTNWVNVEHPRFTVRE